MVDIEFSPIAKEDIKEIYDYLSLYSLKYADSFVEGLFEYIENLKKFPEMGK
jgi:plasmid stabilization system protein ParE